MGCVLATGHDFCIVLTKHFLFSLVQCRLISLQDELIKWLSSPMFHTVGYVQRCPSLLLLGCRGRQIQST